jgi:short subunit dehydrogenase-like uncharacterized protein
MSDHDVVVYGATGFVGALVARHLVEHAPADARIALAGRSRDKLERVRSDLGVDWPLIVADATDISALADLAAATRVVITTVGPYAKYGKALTRACAEAGADYVDLTGEVLFVRASIDGNDALARSTGARIVHSCGFDSVPSDLGVHLLYETAKAAGLGELTGTTLVVRRFRGGFSGGTIASMLGQLDAMKRDPKLRKVVGDPYALSPDRSREPDLGRQPDLATVRAAELDPALKGSLGPFVMAPYNTRVVRRSNALRDWAYGRTFRYRETMNVGGSALFAGGLKLGLGAVVGAMLFPPARYVIDRLLPKPGDGPSEKVRNEGHFTVDLFTTTTTGARLTARVKMHGDPGYAATAVMLGESALALVHDRASLPTVDGGAEGGVLTPATALGDALVHRLRAAGAELTSDVRQTIPS